MSKKKKEIEPFDLVPQTSVEFGISIKRKAEGVTLLEIFQKVAGQEVGEVKRYEFEGVEGKRLVRAVTDFEGYLFSCFPYLVAELFDALYWRPSREKRTEIFDPEEKKDATKALDFKVKRFRETFQRIMLPPRWKGGPVWQDGPKTIEHFTEIRTGRDPIPRKTQEKEKEEFVKLVYEIFEELERKGFKRTQMEVANVLIEREANANKTGRPVNENKEKWIQNKVQSLGLKWSDLKEKKY